jgi:hypothetical protein
VKSGKVTPGQYLILTFNFSAVHRSSDLKTAEDSLGGMINNSIKKFYKTYAPYLGETTSEQLIDKNSAHSAVGSLGACVNLVKEILNNIRDEDDPLYGVKGVSARRRSFSLDEFNHH